MRAVDRDAVRQLVDVAVTRARVSRALALPALEARRRDLDPAGDEVHPNLNPGDVAVEDRRRLRAESRTCVKAALQDDETVIEADERMSEIAANAEADGLAFEHVPCQLTLEAAREDLGPADPRSPGEPAGARLDADRFS